MAKKKYRIGSVDYEFCFANGVIKGQYTDQEVREISHFWFSWADCPLGTSPFYPDKGFDPNDCNDYVDDIEELIPPQLTPDDRKRLIKRIR